MTDETKDKAKKKQGPIRTGAIVPFIIFVTLTALFSIFFLDSTIKGSIEFIGGKVNGAEVNVGFVKSSFKDLKVELGNIQFTNKNKPENNAIDIELIQFNLLWDALLRGKLVVELAEVRGVLLGKKRTSPGEVYPEDEESESNKLTQAALEKVEKEFEGNVFGDIASVLGGGSTGDVGKNIEGSLESKKRFEQLNQEIKTTESAVKLDLKSLPSQGELSGFKTRFKKIRWKDLGNLMKAPKVLQQADKLNKDINKAIKSYDRVSKNTQAKIQRLNDSYKEAESLIGKDLSSVSKRMNLPTLDQSSLARMIFGTEILGKVKEAKKYQSMAQKYMPPKKDNKPEAPVKRERGKGRDYQFGKPNSYPLFWLKLAKINSKNQQGKIEGRVQDVTNDQNATGKLTELNVSADFPGLNVRGVKAKAIIDHRKEPLAKVNAEIKSFLVENKALSNSKDIRFILKRSLVNAKVSGVLKPDKVDLKLKNKFQRIRYLTAAKSSAMDKVLKDVASKTKTLTLNAKVKGAWSDLKFEISSNLAQAIESSVRSLIKQKIEAVQQKIRQDIEKQISAARGSVDKQMAQLKAQYQNAIGQSQKEMNKLKGQLSKEKKNAKKKAKKSLKAPFKGIKL